MNTQHALVPMLCLGALLGFPLLPEAAQQARPPKAVTAEEAYNVLNTLNENHALVSEFFGPTKYGGLKPENCFGVRLPSGALIVGESSGNDHGIDLSSGDKRYFLIGYLHSDRDFSLAGKPLASGAYTVFVAADELRLYIQYETSSQSVALQTPIDPALLQRTRTGKEAQQESPLERPKFSFVQERGKTFLVIEDNRLLLIAK